VVPQQREPEADFNAALGSAGIGLRERRDGYEYLAETGPAKKALPAFGFYVRPWMTIDYPKFPGIGRFESKRFVPQEWRPRVPNPAYIRSRADDLFWAARRVMAFSNEMIEALAKTAEYTDVDAERQLTDVLIQRRDKIGIAYLVAVNPLVDFALSPDGELTFDNAAVDAGVAPSPRGGYRVNWAQFDNATAALTSLGDNVAGDDERAMSPRPLPHTPGTFVCVRVGFAEPTFDTWTPIRACFRRTTDGWTLVGLDRRAK